MSNQAFEFSDREPFKIAARVFTTLLSDQESRANSLNATAGVFAGLGGVVTTLAGIVVGLDAQITGKLGVSFAGASVVLAVVALIMRMPGRDPVEPDLLLYRIMNTPDTVLTEDVLLEADALAAVFGEKRLKIKTTWVRSAAVSLALAIVMLVAGIVRL